MAIDMRWEDENGEERAVVLSPPHSQFASLIPKSTVPDYPCLRYIDPYGDTTFNQLQMPQLLADLQRMLPSCTTSETRQHVEAMIDLVRKATGEVHTYIRFYGD
jgi:hypothetical protein